MAKKYRRPTHGMDVTRQGKKLQSRNERIKAMADEALGVDRAEAEPAPEPIERRYDEKTGRYVPVKRR